MRRIKQDNRGFAMLLVVFLLIALAMIPAGFQAIQISSRQSALQLNMSAQASNVARAGLTDAIDWFRRQSVQPVRSNSAPSTYPYSDAAFYPRESTGDTIDESIGLVREYAISVSNKIWARYEIRRQQNPLSNPIDPQAVKDVTDRRVSGYSAGEGLAWYIESTGYVYQRKDATKGYNEAPNEIVGRARVATEIRRIGLALPANCAVISASRQTTSFTSNSRVVGGSTAVGLGYYIGASGPTISGGSTVTGNPATFDIDGASSTTVDFQAILGVSQTDLKLMADMTVSSMAELPTNYPQMAIVYINGDASFDATRKLRGGGILFVNGNLTVASASNSLFSGLICVTGNATINGPCLISGALVVVGTLTTNGAGDVAEIDFDNSILNSVRQQVAQYRENKATLYTFSVSQ